MNKTTNKMKDIMFEIFNNKEENHNWDKIQATLPRNTEDIYLLQTAYFGWSMVFKKRMFDSGMGMAGYIKITMGTDCLYLEAQTSKGGRIDETVIGFDQIFGEIITVDEDNRTKYKEIMTYNFRNDCSNTLEWEAEPTEEDYEALRQVVADYIWTYLYV